MPKKYVQFKVSSAEEIKNIPNLVKLASTKILIPHLREIYSKVSAKELALEVKKLHKGNKKRFNKIRAFYEKLWEKIGEDYIKNIQEILDFKIKDKKIGYIVPSVWANIADVLGRKNIFIVASEVQQVPLEFIMLHEFTHLYYTDAICKLNHVEAMESPLMEGVDHLILFKSPINKLFAGIKYEEVGFVKKNREFMAELEQAWENKEDFKSFVKEAIKIQSRFPEVVVW